MHNPIHAILLKTLTLFATLAFSFATNAHSASDHVTVGGMEVYFGALPAELIGNDPELSRMHGGKPRWPGYHHLVISLYDSKSGARITDAKVSAKVGPVGWPDTEKKLDPITIAGTITYGNYFLMNRPGLHRITVSIQKAGGNKPVEAKFEKTIEAQAEVGAPPK